jgi:peptidoglycan/xylan/chitin deacetylase (PgdA/CDA1 family)
VSPYRRWVWFLLSISAWIPAAAAGGPASAVEPAYITFCVNVHDILHADESADVLLRLIDLFEAHGVRGDFYLTAPMVHVYEDERPDVIERLRESAMTISYHVRPPHPAYRGFDARLEGLDPITLEQTLRAYETYRLDLETGGFLESEPGGMTYVTEVFCRPPVVATIPFERWRPTLLPIWAELGARMTVTYHETGTHPTEPFVWRDGLLVRPSDVSITRWPAPGRSEASFWWTMLDTPWADAFIPVERLKAELAAWEGTRAPFITVLIHENNFYRRGATPWTYVYYEKMGNTVPKAPPYNLAAPDASEPRTEENVEAIWQAYEDLIVYASAHLRVVTSADVVALAEQAGSTDD